MKIECIQWSGDSLFPSRETPVINLKAYYLHPWTRQMMIWQPERTTDIWTNVVTFGELGHCALGFYGGHWSPNGDSILEHGYGGSFHLWRNVGVDFDNWQPQKVPSAVADFSWGGDYMLSVSHDQATRIFVSWLKDPNLREENAWHESLALKFMATI